MDERKEAILSESELFKKNKSGSLSNGVNRLMVIAFVPTGHILGLVLGKTTKSQINSKKQKKGLLNVATLGRSMKIHRLPILPNVYLCGQKRFSIEARNA